MVGLKTFWITLSALFLLAACVPQTKQTECRANEAFNASLRTCVPIVGGPSSFINVSSYTPQFTQTRSKNDATPLTFTITVSNPYNQSYSVQWERVFNAAPVSISGCGNTLSCAGAISGAYLGTVLSQVGTHIITAKIIDGNNNVVDSQNFELKINDLPRPNINTATITPAAYAFDVLPTDAPIPFSFTIRHNNSIFNLSDGYRTEWSIQKNGSAITLLDDVDVFSSNAPTGSTITSFGDTPSVHFNPSSPLLGVGSYIIRAVVKNDSPGEVVDERQWNVIIKQPDLANVTNISGPAPGVTITAHHDVDYNDYGTAAMAPAAALSWIYGSSSTQPQFCVSVDDRDGTYPGDGDSILVKFYLDSLGGDICTKKTLDTPGPQTVCLVDPSTACLGTALPFDTSLLKFSNSSSSITQPHKVTARLFDEFTGYEFERSDVVPSNGSYPVEWNVLVKPVNTAPVMAFGTSVTNPSGCISAGANTRSGCVVTQGTNFTVSFTVTDDFYTAVSDPGQFEWTVQLKRNGNDIASPPTVTSCTKAFGSAVPSYAGTPAQYTCTLAVPHFIDSGPISPTAGPYQVVATLQDFGSPVGGVSLVAQSLTWNLVVTESNPSGVLLANQINANTDSHISLAGVALDPAVPGSFATEGETIAFNLGVSDSERDDFKYRISLCTINTPTPCSSSTVLTSPAYVDYIRSIKADPDLNPVLFNGLLYTLPEDVLLQVTPIQDITTATQALVYFKVDVVDAPNTLTGVTNSKVFQVYVRNKNPVPVINTATANPAVGSTTVVYSGLPLTIDPGSVTDTGPASETNILYQWYAEVGAGGFTAIPGATTRILTYTPGNIAANITLKMCVGDRPLANPVSSTGTCTGNWTITPKPYLNNLTAFGAGDIEEKLAVWYDEFQTTPDTRVIYSAYSDTTDTIFVEKTVKNAAGNIVLSTSTVSFAAHTAPVNSVSNLSITGTADSIYIAYLAVPTSAPSTNVPRIRRIEKSTTAVPGAKTALPHPDRFGFNYAHYTLSSLNGNVAITLGDGIGGPASITITGPVAGTEVVNIGSTSFTLAAGAGSASAATLTTAINSSALAAVQGITAVNAGGSNVVFLYGQYASDYLDFDGSIALVPSLVSASNGLGKIFIAGGRWNLPFINSSLAGAEQNSLTILSGATDVHLRGTVSLNTTNDLTIDNNAGNPGKVAAFDAKVNQAGELVVALISAELSDAGALSLYRFAQGGGGAWDLFNPASTPGNPTDQSDIAIFSSYSFEDVKLAANAVGNSHYYVLAKEKTANGGEFHIGRYNIDLDSAATPSENFVNTRRETTDSTTSVISDVLMKYPDIVSIPGSSEARIFFVSVGSGATPYPRVARWKSDNTIACGTCNSLSGTFAYNAAAPIGLSQVANNIALGTAGATLLENTKDLVFTLFNSNTSGALWKPQIGIINIESESIQSTTVDATGRWRPPFAK